MSNGSKHKMYNYEVTPPAGVWERIARELDESDLDHEYPAKLAGLEVTPPASAWQSISEKLDEGTTTPITRSYRIPAFLRYAAAAVVAGLLIWAGIGVFNGSSKKEEVARTVEPPVEKTITPTTPTEITDDPVAITNSDSIEQEKRNDAALESSKRTYAKLNVSNRSKIRNAADFHFSLDYTEPIEPEDLDPATRYVVLMTPDGHFIRMSKKLGDLVCCVSGEDQDKECVDQLKNWRNKMASSQLAYSPGNFGDILNLVKALQEDNRQ